MWLCEAEHTEKGDGGPTPQLSSRSCVSTDGMAGDASKERLFDDSSDLSDEDDPQADTRLHVNQEYAKRFEV